MALPASSSEINTTIMEKLPEVEAPDAAMEKLPEEEAAEAGKDKKKKKKEKKKGVDIEDMYSFDVEKLEKAKPVKKKKAETPLEASGEITLTHIQRTLKAMQKFTNEKETDQEKEQHKEKAHDDDASLLCFPSEEEYMPEWLHKTVTKDEQKDEPLLRFPSPSRSRQGSPKKRDESPKKTSMNTSAAEFHIPEMPVKSTVTEPSSSHLKASAAEFVPPGFCQPAKTTSSLQASAAEFVPPGFETKQCSKVVSEPIHDEILSKSEPSSDGCWTHAVLPPMASVQAPSVKQPPATEIIKPVVPALSLNLGEVSTTTTGSTSACDHVADEADAKWSARLDRPLVESLLGKVKQSLMFKLCPGRASTTFEPSVGKVADKVKMIEQKEADSTAEKEREAAIKAIQKKEEQDSLKKDAEMLMDDTLMDCFLQAVKTRVKDRDLPIMGTTLYGKHMRASRRIGTSCDVKDSSFVWLRPFLESLEEAGLIKLKPEVKDPTVTWINRSHKLIKDWEPWHFKDTVGSQKACGPRR